MKQTLFEHISGNKFKLRTKISEGSNMELFGHIPVKSYFRIPGYDSLLQKDSETTAKNCGSGWLNKPSRFGRKGERIAMSADTMVELS